MDENYINDMQQLYNAIYKFESLESYLEDYIKYHNTFNYDDSACSYICTIKTLENNKYILDIDLCPTCGQPSNKARKEQQIYTTLPELFENKYVDLAIGYTNFHNNYIVYKEHTNIFDSLIKDRLIF